ncbi:hypothetical protein [Streptomyces sp. DH10]|uniref:hypothetical protein n=1 Tax=Streptomyces sp. DH10 TaxID=3040121 RepID=UPI002441A191|nr:hypothetical protein [Streptomyces sp. DH10]MDG9709556.1 hypothetical protein [Streptomyces sp. DH10]
MRRTGAHFIAMIMATAAVFLTAGGASASSGDANLLAGVERVSTTNGVTLYSGVKTEAQAAGLCDYAFCAYSSNVGEVMAADDCGEGAYVPSSWRTGSAGGWWQNNLPTGLVSMYNNNWTNIYDTPDAYSADWTANWAPVRYWEIQCGNP